jgi:hypothetical protein
MQVHQEGEPTGVPACDSQGEAGWELDIHLELTASAKKTRQWAYARASLLRQMCCKFARIVTAAAVTQLFIFPDGGLAQLIRQRNELLDVLCQCLYHMHHRVRYRAAPACAGEY